MRRIEDNHTFFEAMEITRKLRRIFVARMKELGFNQTELARRLGKTRANVSVLLSQGNVLSLPVILEFCGALDLNIDIVLTERRPNVVVQSP